MKKAVLAFVLVVLLLVFSVYLFFPAHQTLTESIRLHVPQKTLQRVLMEQSRAHKKASKEQTISLLPDMYDGFIVRVPYKNTTHNSLIRIMALRGDISFIQWNAIVRGGNAPWQRIQTWNEGRKIKNEVQNFLVHLRHLEQTEQVYGFTVNRERVKDTAFIATRFASAAYPTTNDIYKHVGLLEQYLTAQGAAAVGYPMLHVQAAGKGFESMVALPISKVLPGAGPFEPKRMILGNILSAEVKGGAAKVEAGLKQLQFYVADHGYASPAMPFLSLVTDRTKEPDSAKWITRLYYPIL